MSSTDKPLRMMAGAIMKLQARTDAQDLLLKALYVERATQRETFPVEAEEEILALATSLEGLERVGYEGEDRHLADVDAALRAFAGDLRKRLEDQR
ncbi:MULTISPECIES: hypothetical protein [unclassified Aureimonas]|uniref:hypothetical protein n=1 Tax=unclassified Aureimonas TaxID=2615206 RepID=UPI0006FF14FB|nr:MULTISPECIES: hypothetical protein [unclassified Aureimonas]KQT60273.1 hypothetical protein ASG62_06265 [Aureimonas sp. Leaf427]KQT79149.1 hypothetical protein ASG54_08860 [Aureimonas sp. Leaf460]